MDSHPLRLCHLVGRISVTKEPGLYSCIQYGSNNTLTSVVKEIPHGR